MKYLIEFLFKPSCTMILAKFCQVMRLEFLHFLKLKTFMLRQEGFHLAPKVSISSPICNQVKFANKFD